MIYANDLPAHVRKRLPDAPMARARRAADTTAAVKSTEAAGWFRCHRCGATNTAWEAAQRHGREFAGHARVEWVWLTDEGAA